MANRYSGPTALVTGGARRTGRAIATALAEDGYNVLVHYRTSTAAAEDVVGELRGLGRLADALQADLADAAGAGDLVRQVEARTDRLDLLVNNVGNYPLSTPLEPTGSEFRETLETNLVAPYLLIRRSLDLLVAAPAASIVNIGYVGVDHAVANRQAMSYQISKTGLLILTKTLAQELGPKGIRVNMVSPGHLENSVDLPARIAEHVPLGRPGATADVAACIRYLTGEGTYVNGANIEIGGGYRLGLARSLNES